MIQTRTFVPLFEEREVQPETMIVKRTILDGFCPVYAESLLYMNSIPGEGPFPGGLLLCVYTLWWGMGQTGKETATTTMTAILGRKKIQFTRY